MLVIFKNTFVLVIINMLFDVVYYVGNITTILAYYEVIG